MYNINIHVFEPIQDVLQQYNIILYNGIQKKVNWLGRLPLETKNTQNHENQTLDLIESLHMQHCSVRGRIRPLAQALAVFDFQNNQDGLNDTKGNKIKASPNKKVSERLTQLAHTVSWGSLLSINTVNPHFNHSICSQKLLLKWNLLKKVLNPCPAEPGYTLPLQTV